MHEIDFDGLDPRPPEEPPALTAAYPGSNRPNPIVPLLKLGEDVARSTSRSQLENRLHMVEFVKFARPIENDQTLWEAIVEEIWRHNRDIKPRENKRLLALAKVVVGPDASADGVSGSQSGSPTFGRASAWAKTAEKLIRLGIPDDGLDDYLKVHGVDGVRRSAAGRKAPKLPLEDVTSGEEEAERDPKRPDSVQTDPPPVCEPDEMQRPGFDVVVIDAPLPVPNGEKETTVVVALAPDAKRMLAEQPEVDLTKLVPMVRRTITTDGAESFEVGLLDPFTANKDDAMAEVLRLYDRVFEASRYWTSDLITQMERRLAAIKVLRVATPRTHE